ncbi:hypothetical protein TNCT_576541 [Trichonephila clavata]|uniref:Uncharacterized protein n=1 Tax=Trichonephila clavata TaxID=2740835 RepID=A0A8X6H3A5_TRICU|nr:hypothetical protein TNCT_576541 [Trichonephila clavata]
MGDLSFVRNETGISRTGAIVEGKLPQSFTNIPLTELWLNLLGISSRALHHEIFLRLRYSLGPDDRLSGRLLLHVLFHECSRTDEVRSQQ